MLDLAATRNNELRFMVSDLRIRYVLADGPCIDRILVNLVSNAIKYSGAGGHILVTAEQIDDTESGYGNCRFTVADDGIGMSEEFQKHMFEESAREAHSTVSGVQGTGIGLPLAKKLLETMGGTIRCESCQGKGTTFTIVLTFRLCQKELKAERNSETKDLFPDFSGKRALLVEDNELNREITEELLKDVKVAVDSAENGSIAVEIMREKGPFYYDFILMDIQMPVMNGYEATKAIRPMYPDIHMPIIALSANAFAEDKTASVEAGMDDHLPKLINIKELFGALTNLIE